MMYFTVAVACGALIVATLSSRPSPIAHPALIYLGRISYGLYMFHLTAIHVTKALPWPWQPLTAFLLTVAAAALSYRFLEQPFLRLKDRFTYVRSAPAEAQPGAFR
jgi:peptidoglycan/LPS O-acetylase OafA/YrhL